MRILDLFCGQGGAAVGYAEAGWEVVGVDLAPQPRYPFAFHRGDALRYLAEHGGEYDAVHASPPCQAYSSAHRGTKAAEHPRLIAATRALLAQAGAPYVLENVVGARASMAAPITLCGEMFGLGVIRHRLFECSWAARPPVHVRHRGRVRGWRHGRYYSGPYVAVYGEGGGKGTTAEWSAAMGIGWMDRAGLREAIPPAYTRHLGAQLAALLGGAGPAD